MRYFAVEIRGNEPDTVVVELVCRTANGVGVKFAKIEVMDRFTLGTTKFLRCRVKGDIDKLLDKLYGDGRSVVHAEGTGFVVRMMARKGVASTTMMLSTPRSSMVFRGPGSPYWERQFTKGE